MARPTFQVTEHLSKEVKMMASVGCRQEDIAKVLDVTPKTLRKHFRQELDTGAIEANAEVMQTLYRMATSGTNTSVSIFWAKARCGWRENGPIAETKKAKGPQIPGIQISAPAKPEREPLA